MEKILYQSRRNRGVVHTIFLHLHIPVKKNDKAFIFLNPFFDEKKRVQKFQATTARELEKLGFTVARFDYYATGDSLGELFEMEYNHCLNDLSCVVNYLVTELKINHIALLGIRMGASVACDFAEKNEWIRELYLIEPVVEGKRFLLEQRIRRKAFHKLNNMLDAPITVKINGLSYEDHQGFPLSKSLIESVNSLNILEIPLQEKVVHLFSVDFLNRKKLKNLKNRLEQFNQVKYKEVNCSPFWASLESVETSSLTNNIVDNVQAFSEIS